MSHARPISKDQDFHRSQAGCIFLDLHDLTVRFVRVEEQESWTWSTPEGVGEVVGTLWADSVCSNRVILAVIISGCSCMRDLSTKVRMNEVKIVVMKIRIMTIC